MAPGFVNRGGKCYGVLRRTPTHEEIGSSNLWLPISFGPRGSSWLSALPTGSKWLSALPGEESRGFNLWPRDSWIEAGCVVGYCFEL